MKRRFSIRYKLILIFGLLIALASIIEGLLAVRTARKAVIEKVEAHLIDKANDIAEVIDGRITAFFSLRRGLPACLRCAMQIRRRERRRLF